MAEAIKTEPHIVIEGAEADDLSRLAIIDRRFHENPTAFILALKASGDLVTQDTREITATPDNVTDLQPRPADVIIEYFRKRYDLHPYDDGTERVIEHHSEHAQLLARLHATRSVTSRTGVMSSRLVENPLAQPTRDAVRRSRLEIYLGQVLRYQQASATPEQSSLPSAG